ncbi:MAG: bifunctional folylpolyglutamate synthase/dihydrofolate synthase [Dehalococcoidia bacterium]|nr:bifunctional folylpolyglutamate synthase/dihydrofolate synthase [Dehalococcoidia bacterium]
MSYRSALQRLLSLTDFERGTAGQVNPQRRYDLSRMDRLLERLGNPHLQVPAIHITGTKGKGSVSAMLSSIGQASSLKTGLYTSPHLHTFCERIQLNNEPISEDMFAALVEQIWPHLEAMNASDPDGPVTTFEMLTAMAFLCFHQEHCELQVLEVGLGGKLDATNVIKDPKACVITSISLDHTQVLGDTVEAIARDKSGIIKPGAVVVTAPQQPGALRIIERAAARRGVKLVNVANRYRATMVECDLDGQTIFVAGLDQEYRIRLPLLGRHQIENVTCAVGVVEEMQTRGGGLTIAGMIQGLAQVQWPARLEVLQRVPLVVADGAHNPYSMRVIGETLQDYVPHNKLFLIAGLTKGHDGDGIVEQAAKLNPALVIATQSRHPRSVPAAQVAEMFRARGAKAIEAPTIEEATNQALAHAGRFDLVLGIGSLFVAAEMREFIKGIPPELYPEIEQPTAQRTV